MYYLSVVETEWVYGQCYVSSVTWKPDLYDVYVTNDTIPVFEIDSNVTDTEPGGKNANGDNETFDNDTDASFHPVVLQVKRWSYIVKVKYKNMYFKSIIRDPSEAEAIPPMYEKDRVYECLCMVEKLRSEIAFQQETYEKYVAYVKKKQEQDGKKVIDYLYYDDVSDDIFFVVATMWPKIDTFAENHETEKKIKITLVASSLIMLFISIVMLKVFYSYYVKEEGSADYTQVNRI